jgi:hypothetical protein
MKAKNTIVRRRHNESSKRNSTISPSRVGR